ncbi:hypothetical protein D3C81_1818560 [compost metagenome]
MGRHTGRMQKSTGRAVMRSPSALSLRREAERQFWKQIAIGITSEKACNCRCSRSSDQSAKRSRPDSTPRVLATWPPVRRSTLRMRAISSSTLKGLVT